jgi:hypothetical protein
MNLMSNKAETLFMAGSRQLNSLPIEVKSLKNFSQLGKAVHGYLVEKHKIGEVYIISSIRLRSSGWYRSAVLARKGKNGYTIMPKEVAKEYVKPLIDHSTPSVAPVKAPSKRVLAVGAAKHLMSLGGAA